METRTLRYFLAIAQEENMTAAASALHVSQSALSRQMADLEARLGKKLFIRTNRQTLLTEDGMHLRQRAEEILSLIDKTEQELQSSEDEIRGEIRIGAGETRGFSLIARAMRRTQEKYPGIRFSVYSANALDVAERLEHGTLDYGLMFEPIKTGYYQTLAFPCSDRIGLLVRRDDPLASRETIMESDLLSVPLLVSSRMSPDTVLTQFTKRQIQDLDIRGSYNLIYNASLMVEEGIGLAIAIEGLIPTGGESPFRFLPIEPAHEMKMVLAWKKSHIKTKAEQVFLEELEQVLQEAE